MNESARLLPTAEDERVRELDIVRGFALLGILMANMAFFATPNVYMQTAGLRWFTDPLNQTAETLIHFFATSKFFTMFSFLFGLGFVLFLQRAEQKVKRPRLLFARRLFFLLIIGLIHGFGVWHGDILTVYSISGVLLLLFYRRKPKTVLIWAFVFVLVPSIFMALLALLFYSVGDQQLVDTAGMLEAGRMVEQSVAAYGSGNLADIFSQRAVDFNYMLSNSIAMLPIVFSMFLFGVYAAKTGRFRRLSAQTAFYRKLWLWSLLIGLPFNVLGVYSNLQIDSTISVYLFTYFIGTAIGGPALCFFYISSIVLLSQKASGLKLLLPLQAVGRMALSNYLLQSVVCTAIFYSYGLGLYGKVGPFVWLWIALALFGVQIAVSRLWFRKFRFGPAEWLWRSLTYGKRQPFARTMQPAHNQSR